jgi:hypothetical protein
MLPISEKDEHGPFQCDSPGHTNGHIMQHIPANPQEHSSKTLQIMVVVQAES